MKQTRNIARTNMVQMKFYRNLVYLYTYVETESHNYHYYNTKAKFSLL